MLICSFCWLGFYCSPSALSSRFLVASFYLFIYLFFTRKTSWVRRDFILKNNDHISKVTADKLKVTPFSAGEKCSSPPNLILPLFV
jgi:hypothetical protein